MNKYLTEIKKIKSRIKSNKIISGLAGAVAGLSIPNTYLAFTNDETFLGSVFVGIGVFYGYLFYKNIKDIKKYKTQISELEKKLE